MEATAILSELHSRGVTIAVAGDKLRLVPGSLVPHYLLEDLRDHRADILALLRDPTELMNLAFPIGYRGHRRKVAGRNHSFPSARDPVERRPGYLQVHDGGY